MIDLHVHSTFSDGSLTPEQLVDEAVRAGLSALALTDHDSTGGLGRFLAAARGKPLKAVPGVEISADFKQGTMHMLGYFIRPEHAELNESLRWIREGREIRNQEILHKLNRLGFMITWEEVASYAGEDVVGRPHFAQALLAHKYVANKDEAFDKYLGKGKPAYAERRRFSPEDSIRLIRAASGIPVLAHPFTLNLSKKALRELVGGLRDQGLQGIEVYYPEHAPEMQAQYAALARELALVATGGSDFHGAMTPDIKLGRGFGALEVPDEALHALEVLRKK